nr:leucine-rich repeat protein [Butyricicoccus sp. AF86-03b2A]
MKKRLLSAILSFFMLLTMAPTVAFAADGDDEAAHQNNSVLEGSCGAEGDNVTWKLTENDDSLYCVTHNTTWRFYDNADNGGDKVQAYTLTIAGEGAMADYGRNTTPWGLKLAEILKVDASENNTVSDYCSPRITRIEFAAGSKVTYIGAHAFRSTSISSIAIPDSVKSIGAYAFIMCRHLTSIKASNLSDRAFYVKDDVLYEDYTENGKSGVALRFFPLAKWHGAYTIDSRVTAIGNNSMQQAEITSVTIPATVRSINSFAFNSSEITSVTFKGTPSFGTEFESGTAGSGIFSNCKKLTTINNFPKNVKVLPASLFSGAVRLTHFEIPASVTEIGDTAFSNTGITEITIPSGVSKIGSRVFSTSDPEDENGSAVRSSVKVTFEKGSKLTSIGSACFAGLKDYTAIFAPEDEAAYGAFAQAGYQVSLAGRELPQDNTFVYGWVDENSVQIIDLTDTGKKKADITIPDMAVSGEQSYQVVGIGDSVFAGTSNNDANTTLTSVKLGANLKYISSTAFRYCTHLTNVDFSKAVKLERIGSNAFYDTNAVTGWDLSACEKLTTVDTGAFNYTKTSITIKLPANITSWGNNVINSKAMTVHAAASSETFKTLVAVLNAGNDKFTFAGESGNAGKFTYESRYENGAFIVTITGFAANVSAEDKATVEIPDTITVDGAAMAVTAVADQAFVKDCNKIKTVTIGANVATIGNQAFAAAQGNTTTLESVTFKDGVPVSIRTRAFQKYGSSLKTFDAGKREVALGDNVFLDDRGLTYVNISNATSLGKGVFYNLNNATTSGTLVINGAAISDAKSFENVTTVTSQGYPLSKMTVYVVGDNGNAGATTTALRNAGVNILCLTDGGTFPAGTSFKANKLAVPSKTGYTFDGWYSSSNFDEETKLTDNNHPVTGTTYYAKWTMISSITLSSNANDAVTYGTSVVTLTTAPTSSQWTYTWYKDADGNNVLDTTNDTKIDNDGNTLVLKNVSDSGTYWVVVSDGKNNNATSNKVTVTIVKADGNASVSLSGWIYGETASEPVPTSDTNGINNVTYQYKVKGADDTTYSDTLPINAGDYTVKATFAATDNYNEVTAEADFTIAKATPAIAIKATPSTLTGGGSVELTVSGVPTEGKLAVTCDNDITVNEKDGKYTAQLPNVTKNYTFTAKYTGTDNYNDVEKTCVVKVTRKSSHSSSSGSSTTSANTVSASTASNGKVSLDKSTAKKGNTVTVTVTPDAGYQLDKLTVTDAKGKAIAVTKKSDSKYTFTMPDSKVTITPTFSKIENTKPSKTGFNDVASSAWYADAVQYVTDKGLMNGTDDNQFSPNASTTRGMLMTVLARYAGEDTTGGATWYEKGMNWAKAKGVSDGTNPNANITREQLVTMLYRYAGTPAANGSLSDFSDTASVSSYAVNAMQWAVENGIVNGSNGKLNPQNNATRAEVAAILMRFCEMSK